MSAPSSTDGPAGSPLRLAVEDAGSREAWEAAAAGVLRRSRRLGQEDPDSAVWDVLTRSTLDGFGVRPLGTAQDVADLPAHGEPGLPPFTRGSGVSSALEGWDIRTPVLAPDPATAREEALVDLDNGATSLWLQLVPGGLAAGDLATVLDGVLLDLAPVALEAPLDPVGAAEALVAVLDDRGTDPHPGTNLGGDPLGQLLRRLALDGEEGEVSDDGVVGRLAGLARGTGVRALVVDATAAHDLGASDGQELGWSLAVGAAYLRQLVAAGVDVDTAAGLVDFRYAVTDEQLTSIAKLRAARRVWHRVCQASGVAVEARGQRQHAVTSRPMMARVDPWVNILRTTVAAFAAGAGGAAAVTVLPFDAPLGVPAELGRRVARNVSSLLV